MYVLDPSLHIGSITRVLFPPSITGDKSARLTSEEAWLSPIALQYWNLKSRDGIGFSTQRFPYMYSYIILDLEVTNIEESHIIKNRMLYESTYPKHC